MIKKFNNIFIKAFIFLGIVFSFFVFINIKKEGNALDFTFHKHFDISFIDIALNSSSETSYFSNFLGILAYIIAMFLIIIKVKDKNMLINISFVCLLILLLLFDTYCIYLIKVDHFLGQHIKMSLPILLIIYYLYKKNR